MVLADLGRKIQAALSNLTSAPIVDEKTFDRILQDICKALLDSDVNIKLVHGLRENVKRSVNLAEVAEGINKRRLIQKTVFDELCKLVDPGVEPFKPVKGKSNVVMFVGLQGSGKTTSCTKYAFHYMKKGWKVGLVCADTFRAGAFDQLKQNASKAKIPFFGSYTEADPVQIAREGVEKFKGERFELIIVDTSGRHKQESELFEEMKEISLATKPDNVIFVMDASIGQAAESQASAFHSSIDIGSIIVTKMDGHAKGGGALSGVAVTRSPIVFIGTGEHIYDLEPFNVHSFVNKMLGYGDISGMVETVKDLNLDENSDFAKKIEKGIFTLREMQEQFQMILQLGPLSKVMSMLPGLNSEMFRGSDQDVSKKMKRCMAILDSMTEEELNSDGKIFVTQDSRVLRVALGSGTFPLEVHDLLSQYKKFAHIFKSMGGKSGLFGPGGLGASLGGGGGSASGAHGRASAAPTERTLNQMTQQLSKFVPPDMLRQMGGAAGLGNFMRQFENSTSTSTPSDAPSSTKSKKK